MCSTHPLALRTHRGANCTIKMKDLMTETPASRTVIDKLRSAAKMVMFVAQVLHGIVRSPNRVNTVGSRS